MTNNAFKNDSKPVPSMKPQQLNLSESSSDDDDSTPAPASSVNRQEKKSSIIGLTN